MYFNLENLVHSFSVHESDITRLKESPNQRWQMLSTGFDALLGFASTELERGKEIRRKSLETEPAGAGSGGPGRSPGTAGSSSWSQSRSQGSSPRGHPAGKGAPGGATTQRMEGEEGSAAPGHAAHRSPRGGGVSPAPTSPSPHSRSSSVESSHKQAHKSRRDKHQSPDSHRSRSRTRSRSRSRSHSRSPSGDRDSGGEDKYSKYDKHFKKKFFGRDYNWKKQSTQRYAAETPVKFGSKFKPKGKDWERNHRGGEDKDRSMSPSCPAPPKLSPVPPPTTSPSTTTTPPAPLSSTSGMGRVSGASSEQQPGPGFYTSNMRSAAMRGGFGDGPPQPSFTSAGLRPVVSNKGFRDTPPPLPPHTHRMSPSGPPSLSAQVPNSFAPSPSPPNLRGLDQPPRLTLATTPPAVSLSNHLNMVRHHMAPDLARGALGHFSHAGGHLAPPTMLPPGADARHYMPMLAGDLSGPPRATGFPHGFRPGDLGGPRPPMLGDMMGHRPTFGGDPAIGVQRAMFPHLGRPGKDKNWKNYNSGGGSSHTNRR